MKITKKIIGSVSLAALVVATGCASIVSGTTQKIKIASIPTDSSITISQFDMNQEANFWEGKTPATVKLNRKKSYLVKISREGYKPVEVSVQYNSMNGWVWGNLLIGGIIGIIIDASDGAANNLGPDDINVQLVERKMSSLGNKSGEDYVLLRSVNGEGKMTTQKLLLSAVEQ